MKSYLTLSDASAEITVQRSRFIAYVFRIANETEAKEKLSALRKRHYDATHVCYAYVADGFGNLRKSSDDGEPSGSAGAPIAAVLAPYGKVLLAVVRYFGGTKLGVGGLVKAYTDAAAEAVKNSEPSECLESDIYKLTLNYNDFERCRRIFSKTKILNAGYGEAVELTFAFPCGYDIISELTCVMGKMPDALLVEKSSYIEY